jgi:hypothetical protein
MVHPAPNRHEVLPGGPGIYKPQLPALRWDDVFSGMVVLQVRSDVVEFLGNAQVDVGRDAHVCVNEVDGVVGERDVSPAESGHWCCEGGCPWVWEVFRGTVGVLSAARSLNVRRLGDEQSPFAKP